jgi:hypothetical protein
MVARNPIEIEICEPTPDEILKERWLHELRTSTMTPCLGNMVGEDSFCAIGLLAHLAGSQEIEYEAWHIADRVLGGLVVTENVWRWNDNGVPWPEIADRIERWGE